MALPLGLAGKVGLWVWGQNPGEWVRTWPENEVARRVVSVAVASDVWRSPGLALMEDGTVQAWGQDNSSGQLGDGGALPGAPRLDVQVAEDAVTPLRQSLQGRWYGESVPGS